MPYGIELAQAAGAQGVMGGINEGMGLLFAGPKRNAQMKTARQMQDLQMKGDKEMTDFNMKKQLEMWEATGYGAQVDQMKRAGINPALLYGMGSGGGQTANVSQGNVSGQSAQPPQPTHGTEGMGLMIGQMGLLQAQKENIEADTANKKAQAGESTTRTDIGKVELQFKKDSYEDNLDIIRAQFSNLQEDANRKNRENRIGDATEGEATNKIRAEALKACLENELIKAQTAKTDQEIEQSKAQIQKWAAEISQTWFNLDRQERELQLKTWETSFRVSFPGLGASLGRIITGATEQMNSALGGGELPRYEPPNTKPNKK